MKIEYFKEYSPSLGREMEFKVYGHGGKPCIVFACQDARFFDFENQGMFEIAAPWIDAGKVQFFCVDGVIDSETWSDVNGDPARRTYRMNQWYHYIMDDFYPRMMEINGSGIRPMVTGCSMGATHAAIFALRRPDVFDAMIAMSGLYDARNFFGNYMDGYLYENSPVDFMRNLPNDHPYVDLLNQNTLFFCIGQGAWEGELLPSNRELARICWEKGIHAYFDFWGYDVCHDWPWWKVQFPYFLEKVFGPANG